MNAGQNTFGLLMSLNMLIENGDAFDYTADDFERWAKAAGFQRTELIPLTGATSAVGKMICIDPARRLAGNLRVRDAAMLTFRVKVLPKKPTSAIAGR